MFRGDGPGYSDEDDPSHLYTGGSYAFQVARRNYGWVFEAATAFDQISPRRTIGRGVLLHQLVALVIENPEWPSVPPHRVFIEDDGTPSDVVPAIPNFTP